MFHSYFVAFFFLQTDEFHTDHALLDRAVEALEEIIQEVDRQTGEAKCKFTYDKLEFIDDKQVSLTTNNLLNPSTPSHRHFLPYKNLTTVF